MSPMSHMNTGRVCTRRTDTSGSNTASVSDYGLDFLMLSGQSGNILVSSLALMNFKQKFDHKYDFSCFVRVQDRVSFVMNRLDVNMLRNLTLMLLSPKLVIHTVYFELLCNM